jgi:hypothetical protein
MYYIHTTQVAPYGLYGDTKLDQMPYQNDQDSMAEDLFSAIPKFSEFMPSADELTDPTAIAKLPALKALYERDEAHALARMRRPNPLLNENWGKSKMEIVAEAKMMVQNDERKVNLMKMLKEYQEEDELKKQIKVTKADREKTIKKMFDNAIL